MTRPAVPRVAVCMAVCNGANWIDEQLRSILGQQGVELTVFVGVDQSHDGSAERLARHQAVDSRVRILPSGQGFGSAAANFFYLLREIDFTGFDHVALADQDDVWFSDKLVRAVAEMRRQGGDAYSSNVIALWPDGRQSLVDKAQPLRRWDHLFEAAGPGCTYVMSAALVEALRAVLDREGKAVAGIALHDWFIYAFARTQGFRWVIDPRPGMLYRQHASNVVGVNAGWRALLRRATMVGSGWAFQQAALIAHLSGAARDPQVLAWFDGSRASSLRLARHACQCRRRRRDRLFFLLSCVLMFVTGPARPR